MNLEKLPIAVIGAGPVGLAAAARILERGETPIVIEAGETAGASVLKWSHIRMFSPWKYNVDEAAVKMLEAGVWQKPDCEAMPTGRELFDLYLKPLSEIREIRSNLESIKKRGDY